MAKALLIIDYTNDFVADKGSLTVGKPAQTLAPEIMRLADQFLSQHDYVIFPTDGHRLNDPFNPETKLYPAHNIIGTTGQKLYGQVGSWFDQHHDDSHVYKFNKNRYSSFQNTNLDNYLRERRIDEVWIAGVCTDICVLHTAISAYNLDYHMVIPQAAVATFSPAGAEWAMNHFKNVLGGHNSIIHFRMIIKKTTN